MTITRDFGAVVFILSYMPGCWLTDASIGPPARKRSSAAHDQLIPRPSLIENLLVKVRNQPHTKHEQKQTNQKAVLTSSSSERCIDPTKSKLGCALMPKSADAPEPSKRSSKVTKSRVHSGSLRNLVRHWKLREFQSQTPKFVVDMSYLFDRSIHVNSRFPFAIPLYITARAC